MEIAVNNNDRISGVAEVEIEFGRFVVQAFDDVENFEYATTGGSYSGVAEDDLTKDKFAIGDIMACIVSGRVKNADLKKTAAVATPEPIQRGTYLKLTTNGQLLLDGPNRTLNSVMKVTKDTSFEAADAAGTVHKVQGVLLS